MDNWSVVGQVYQCDLNSDPQITSPGVTITSATGEHIDSSMTHASVKSFYTDSTSRTLNFFPRGLNGVFPNLEAIFMRYGRLIEVHQSDLKPFTTLRYLRLDDNDIRTLEKDLFKFNTALEYIGVHNNKITSIHPTVFDHLTKLTILYVYGNECVGTARSVNGNREEVFALIEDVKRQCSDFDWQNFLKINKVEHDLMEFRERSENQSSAVERTIKGLQVEMNQKLTVMQEKQEQMELKSNQQVSFLTFITEKEPFFFFVALPSVLLLTVLNVLVIFACLNRGEKKKEEECVAGAAEEGVELREMRDGGA
jgi:hypothetical protein